jgi:UDP-N-acetylmuramoylalanine--D-glutamate ligase
MRVLVLGAARSGTAAARLARADGHRVTVFDEKPLEASALVADGIGVVSGAWSPDLLSGIDLVVASPGFSERSAPIVDCLEAGVEIWSEIEFAWRHLSAPVLAVTGTNGKTTVTEAATAMLQASGRRAMAVGNIGVALSAVVGEAVDVFVLEVSSFQLRFTVSFRPDTAVLLNVAPDHLDWHGSFGAYAASKAMVFAHQVPSDLLVFDADDEGASRLARAAASRLHPVSATRVPGGGSGVEGEVLHLPGVDVPLADLERADSVMLVDLAAAAVAALDQGAKPEAAAAVCREFRPPPHRRSLVRSRGGVEWIDDSKATNPHSALAAIRSYPSVVLIAGGLAKGLDLTPLAREPNVTRVIAIGSSGPDLAAAAGERGVMAGSMTEAVQLAAGAAGAGDTVLLAPGCASFDMFESYADRGERFAAAVNALPEGADG